MPLSPVALEGAHVRLVPLAMEHAPVLLPVALHDELWRWTISSVQSAADLDRCIATALREREIGTALPFATIHRASGQPIGSTRFGNCDADNRRVEIRGRLRDTVYYGILAEERPGVRLRLERRLVRHEG